MATEIAFKPFSPLRSEGQHLEDRFQKIQSMIDQGEYARAIDASTELMTITLAAFRYLQTYFSSNGAEYSYDWLFLRSLVTAGFIGWTLFVLIHVFDSYILPKRMEHNRNQIVSPFCL